MIPPRWRKVWRDLAQRRGRVALTALALGAALFEIGTMLYAYALLRPELGAMYARTRPAAATLTLDDASDAVVARVRRVPGVADAEARPVVVTRLEVGPGEWTPAVLYVVRDFAHQKLDTFVPERGAWPPADGEVLLERTALAVAKTTLGGRVVMRGADGVDRRVVVSGTVHAAGLPPAWMEHMVTGFIGPGSTLRGPDESAQIRIRVADHPLDEGYVRAVADSVRAALEHDGHVVTRVTVPPPGRHPHAAQMEAFLFLVMAFGVLGLLLGAALVAATTQAMMTEQRREIGILKAIGAGNGAIARMYLGHAALLAVAGAALGVPAGLWAGRGYARFSAGILNTDITNAPFPVWVVVAELGIGLAIPLLFALLPVLAASRISVREALGDAPGAHAYGTRAFDRALARLTALPRPLSLALRTALARRGRLALTLGMLGAGGAVFMAALNVSGAWTHAVDADFASRRFDIAVGLSRPVGLDTLAAVLATVPEVTRFESWPGANVYRVGPGGIAGAGLTLLGVPDGSRLFEPRVMRGRWLRTGDRSGAVVNQAVLALDPALRVGDTLTVRVAGHDVALPLIGVVKELTPMAAVYAPEAWVRAAAGLPAGRSRAVRVVIRRHDAAGQLAAAAALESAFAGHGLEVAQMQRMRDLRQSILDHLVIIMSVLTLASLVVVLVGGLGLVSTLTLEVVRRTREIGIMSAIGATPRMIASHIAIESLVIGVVSWGVAMLLALPASAALESACGRIFLQAPLDFQVSVPGMAAWLVLVMLLSLLCSVVPARRAARLPVSQALGQV